MLGAAKEDSNETKPVNSATLIPPFTASHACAAGSFDKKHQAEQVEVGKRSAKRNIMKKLEHGRTKQV